MDTQKVNGVAPKENGIHRRLPSYSVETPYGFHLDLDFVKYVEDIEKGNTIRRVQLQRRPRGRSTGNLSRNLSLPGYSCSQWNSTSVLFPRTRLADSQQPCEFQCRDGESTRYTSQSEAPFKTSLAFDEQPLGPHARPNLLRASSLPLTVILRKYSSDDPTSPNGSRDFLSQENSSSEDVFHGQEGINGTLQQLTAALQRVGELEMEIRIIPELKAQICILQEEQERLLHTFRAESDINKTLDFPRSMEMKNNAKENWMDWEYNPLEENIKTSSGKVEAIAITKEKSVQATTNNLDAESLTGSLQKKITMLEQKLRELESDLEKTTHHLKEQEQESRSKDERISELTKRQAEKVWVRPDNMRDTPEEGNKSEATVQKTFAESESSKVNQVCSEHNFKSCLTRGPPGSQADMEHHVNRVRELLQEQWECLCRDEESGKELSSEHLPSQVRSIQTQLVSLVNLLTLYVSPAGHEAPSVQGSVMKDQISVVKTWECPEKDDDIDCESGKVAEGSMGVIYPAEGSLDPNFIQIEKLSSSAQSTRTQEPSRETTHWREAEEHHGKWDRMCEAQCPDNKETKKEEKQNIRGPGAESEETSHSGGVRGAEPDFMKACHFLEEHMDQISEPNDEMRQALTVVFQHWFHVCAEENSCADTVTLYINKVSTETPAVLQFLVNMVDDNGNTVLHYSVSHCNFSIARLLLHTGVCDVDLKNNSGYTAIMLASLQPLDTDTDTDVVQRLMELGDVNACVGHVGQTALHLAVRHGRASTVRLLLAHGANVNAQDQAGTTALISACDRGHTDIVRILLQDPSCDVNLTDKGSRSALSLATQASHTEIADLLKARSSSTKAHDKCKMA
ncbi:KN motif and ankyrin repeat domain-containing protein 4 [Bagarius yarrelli]|uniref:KN motif and ankyrin repeat domain-containing protein 4 n=1 Tax=Bagarius yarrelli TaxID=175774 RepID=A0A556TZT0_BAGYA|nr:KN motif and ankyrin repeat domain-containing protein 4 [Bagarius yarrelli]